ncbi:MAG TPA: acyl carrier protein [Thermomonospora sp.]|nr:acyl carrier protein [Thermomonospora sp.]
MSTITDIAHIVATATDGTIPVTAHTDETTTFAERGMTSLAFLRMVDALELKYGVEIDLETELDRLTTVFSIAAYLRDHDAVDD